MLIAALAVVMASCTKEEAPPAVQVNLSATGTGTFEVGWYDHTWNKTWAQDQWQLTVEAHPGDTVRLAAYGNLFPVELHLDTIGVVIMPQGYLMMQFIVK